MKYDHLQLVPGRVEGRQENGRPKPVPFVEDIFVSRPVEKVESYTLGP